MAKEVAGLIKLQIKGGAANPSPPVGLESAMRLVAGTARSMGITVKGEFPGNN